MVNRIRAFALSFFCALALCATPFAASPAHGQAATYNSTAPTLSNKDRTELQADVNGNLKVAPTPPTGTSSTTVQGSAATGATAVGNPVQTGGIASALPSAVSSGQMVAQWMGTRGQAYVVPSDGSGNSASFWVNNSDAIAPDGGISKLAILSYSTVFDGTNWLRFRGDTNGIAALPGISSTYWSYSNGATGILSNTTTAVTIKTAAGASVRNFIDSCTINSTAFGTSVPLAIRDGAAGTVIWAVNVPTAGFLQPVVIQFAMPLRSTANTLLEVVTTTANTSGTVWVSCQGHTGS